MSVAGYHASSMQRQFWSLWRLDPEGTAYHVPTLFHLRGELDVPALVAAIEALVLRHDALRTTFEEREGDLLARVHSSLPPKVVVLQSPIGESVWGGMFAGARFDLGTGPLLCAYVAPALEGGHWLALLFHHIAVDLRSKERLGEELGELYARRRAGTPDNPPITLNYVAAAAEEQASLDSEAMRHGVAYFARHLDPLPSPLALPCLDPRAQPARAPGNCIAVHIGDELHDQLKVRASAARVKPFLFLLANWALLLARYSGTERIAVGVPFTNRRRSSWQDVVGCFVGNLPLALTLGTQRFDDLVAEVRTHMLGHHRHQEVPLALLLRELRVPREPGRNPLFQAGFTFEPPMHLTLPGIEVASRKVHAGGAQLEVFLTMWETANSIEGWIEYDSRRFTKETISAMARNFERQLRCALDDGGRPVQELDWLAPEEQQRVVVEFNRTEVEWTDPAFLPLRFLRQAETTPTAVALSMGGTTLTYAETRERALAVAEYLVGRGVGPGERVGVFQQRSLALVPSLLGVLLSGAAYVPIEPEYPAERIRRMLEDARPRLVLGHAATSAQWSGEASLFHDVEGLLRPKGRFVPAEIRGEDAAYVIFTSGSTGRPKGAVNTHAGLLNRLLWMDARYPLGQDDVVIQKTPCGFDVSTWEFFWSLLRGARLEIAPPGAHRDPLVLARLFQQARITVAHFVPSMLRVFLEHPEARCCTHLRRLFASGEALSSDLVVRCRAALGASLHNLYGPTEAAVDVTAWDCDEDPARDPVPIGRPVANTRMYVLDTHGRPVPVGVPGELFIGGVQVATGYVNRPELSTERFVPDPFSGVVGARLYRTGDLARWERDGVLTFLGRLDHQVKIRGQRIELSEIEATLERCSGVSQSVVVAHPPGDANARLVAYVAGSTGLPAFEVLREACRRELPDAMVPRHFVALDRLPLNASGKVDRQALPKPSEDEAHVGPLPVGGLETWLAAEWCQRLAVTAVSRDANFFDLGGDSLRIASLAGRVREHLGLDVPVVAFFEHPTVASLAAHLDALCAGKPGNTSSDLDLASQRAARQRDAAHARGPRRR